MSGPDFWPKSYAKPAEDVSDLPSIDNTVKVGRMNADGMIEFTSLDDMKLEWIQDTFGLRIPPNQRLAIIQQIAAIGG